MKIVFIAKDFPPSIGGGQVFNKEISLLLAARGHQMHVVTWTSKGNDMTNWPFTIQRLERISEHHSCPCDAIPRILQEQKPDVVLVSPTSKYIQSLFPMLARAKVPYAVLCHFLRLKQTSKNPIRKYISRRRYGFAQANLVVAVSHYLAEMLQKMGVPQEKIRVVHPGVNVQRFRPDPEVRALFRRKLGLDGKRVLLSVSRLIAGKGQDRVIALLPSLVKKIPNLIYLVVGSGPMSEVLKQQARELGVAEQVKFVGDTTDPYPYYAAADVFTLPSTNPKKWHDAFGITILEAGACGLPAIASNEGGAREIIEEGKTGVLVNVHDARELGAALASVLSKEDQCQVMGQTARKKMMEYFSWDRTADEAEQVLRQLSTMRPAGKHKAFID